MAFVILRFACQPWGRACWCASKADSTYLAATVVSDSSNAVHVADPYSRGIQARSPPVFTPTWVYKHRVVRVPAFAIGHCQRLSSWLNLCEFTTGQES
jgi:hypothetical protein